MEIPRSLLDELSDEVNALSGAAQQQASIALGNVISEWDGESVAVLRTASIAVLEAIEGEYTDLSAACAAKFYDEVRAVQGAAGKYSAVVESMRDQAALDGAVRAIVQTVVDTGQTDKFVRESLARVDADCRRSANKCVAYNAKRDPAKPRYARVPRGGETCGFCLMLASFGFHYRTEEAASHAHKHCDCRVVPEFGKASIKGYNPTDMYKRYGSCLDTIGGRDGIRSDWMAMPQAEREAYITSHGKKESAAFQAYMNKRIAQEIETRDATWFATGKLPEVKIEPSAKLLPKEESVVSCLRDNHGFAVTARATRSSEAKRTSDILLGTTPWEIKQPVGNGKQTIYHQFEEAAAQSDRLVLDISVIEKTESGTRWDRGTVETAVKRYIRWHYKDGDGRDVSFKEVMLVSGNWINKINRGN